MLVSLMFHICYILIDIIFFLIFYDIKINIQSILVFCSSLKSSKVIQNL